jgi:hypothetical protein
MEKIILFFMELFYVAKHKVYSKHLVSDGYFYFTKVDRYGPYCKECWDLNKNRIIGRIKKKKSKGNIYMCTTCQKNFNTEDHIVIKLQKNNK